MKVRVRPTVGWRSDMKHQSVALQQKKAGAKGTFPYTLDFSDGIQHTYKHQIERE
jgi:hypothetical protein